MARAQIALTPEAHRALISFTAQLTGLAERRVTQSEAVLAAISVSRKYEVELRSELGAAPA